MSDKYTYKKKEQKKNNYTYEVVVSNDYQKEVQDKVYKELSKDVKVAGFRPGKAPKDMIEGKIAMDVLNETVNRILPDVSYEILNTEKLNPLSRLEYAFKEFNKDGGLTFEFSFANSPEIKVSDLKKIKVTKKVEPVTDTEVDMVIRNIIQSTLPKEKWSKEGSKKEDLSDEASAKSDEKKAEDKPFEITDEMISELGYEDEKTVEGMRKKVRESLQEVKDNQAEDEFTSKVLEEAMKVVDFEVPHNLIHEEIHNREHAFLERLKNINLDLEAYLKTQNKTMEQIHEEWHKDIEKGAFGDILAINLAVQEKLVPTEEDMEKEIEKVEDKVLQVQYRGNPQMRDQLRTFLTRNNGIKKLVEIVKGK